MGRNRHQDKSQTGPNPQLLREILAQLGLLRKSLPTQQVAGSYPRSWAAPGQLPAMWGSRDLPSPSAAQLPVPVGSQELSGTGTKGDRELAHPYVAWLLALGGSWELSSTRTGGVPHSCSPPVLGLTGNKFTPSQRLHMRY